MGDNWEGQTRRSLLLVHTFSEVSPEEWENPDRFGTEGN